MKRSATQIKAEIKVLQKELLSLGTVPDEERLEEFHNFCVDHFGRRLKIGDVLEKNVMMYPPGKKPHKVTSRVKVVKPITNDYEVHDKVARIYWGYPNIDVQFLTKENGRFGCTSITKTEVRTYKLAKCS